jgi:hypothetical protein
VLDPEEVLQAIICSLKGMHEQCCCSRRDTRVLRQTPPITSVLINSHTLRIKYCMEVPYRPPQTEVNSLERHMDQYFSQWLPSRLSGAGRSSLSSKHDPTHFVILFIGRVYPAFWRLEF